MTLPTSLRFGRFEMHLPRRELLLAGTPQVIAPKVFDLLSHLLLNHDRAVPKAELIQRLWPGVALSDTVLARTAMATSRW